jgi:hypothetical protein
MGPIFLFINPLESVRHLAQVYGTYDLWFYEVYDNNHILIIASVVHVWRSQPMSLGLGRQRNCLGLSSRVLGCQVLILHTSTYIDDSLLTYRH